jgi:hypothetical protein
VTILVNTLRWIRTSALGRRDASAASAWHVIGWWESRRIPFNLIVGAAGILTSGAILVIALVGERLFGVPFGLPDPPIFAILGVVFFAAAANVCYTGGWIAELIVRRAWPDQSDMFGTLTFTLGLPFAVVVTLAPAFLIGALGAAIGLADWLGYRL